MQDIMNEPDEIIGLKGNTIPRKISVEEISFSAHVDFQQNSEFIDLVKAPHIVCGYIYWVFFVLLSPTDHHGFRSWSMENRTLWGVCGLPCRPNTMPKTGTLKYILRAILKR